MIVIVNPIIFYLSNDEISWTKFGFKIIYLAVNYKLNASYAFELGYMNWFQQQKSGVDFYNRDILRLSIIHSIDLKKKKNE